MKVELSRYRVKDGKSDRVDEWMAMLNRRIDECIDSLEREKMKLEVIFRELLDGKEYVSWFSVQGEDSLPPDTSLPIDEAHYAFADECLEVEHGRRDAQPQLVLVPPHIATAMEWPDPPSAAAPFERREIVLAKQPPP